MAEDREPELQTLGSVIQRQEDIEARQAELMETQREIKETLRRIERDLKLFLAQKGIS